MINGLTIDELTCIDKCITDMRCFEEIPFPLKRNIIYNKNTTLITITVNYVKLNLEQKNYQENENYN